MVNKTLTHHGIKGMRWGVRRYQNNDGTLTPEGRARYRNDYDDVKTLQKLSERSTTTNAVKTPIKSVNDFLNKQNAKIYDKNAKAKLKLLINQIGDKRISELDEDVRNEGKKVANAAKTSLDKFYRAMSDSSFNYDPDSPEAAALLQKEYDRAYNKYLDEHLLKHNQ